MRKTSTLDFHSEAACIEKSASCVHQGSEITLGAAMANQVNDGAMLLNPHHFFCL
jgi:hypothetical protein